MPFEKKQCCYYTVISNQSQWEVVAVVSIKALNLSTPQPATRRTYCFLIIIVLILTFLKGRSLPFVGSEQILSTTFIPEMTSPYTV
jgi:hypothetical protein